MYTVLMFPQNLERNLEVSKLCQDLLASNDRVYFVSSLNKNGRIIDSKFRNERIIKNLSPQQLEMFYMQRTLQLSLSREFDDELGSLDYIIIERNNFLEFMFPLSFGSLLVITDIDIIPRYFAKKISYIIREFEYGPHQSLCA